jgi:NADPH:quinone reductase-like Zn-dependent oxidoreductase
MPRAVRYSQYGGVDVLRVVGVDRPVPAAGQFLLKVKAAGINPGEAFIREGGLHEAFPATFPSGQGYDLAGVIEEVDADAAPWAVGDEVAAFTFTRSAQAARGGRLQASFAGLRAVGSGRLFGAVPRSRPSACVDAQASVSIC